MKKILIISQPQFGYHSGIFNYAKYLSNNNEINVLCHDGEKEIKSINGVNVFYIKYKFPLISQIKFILKAKTLHKKINYDLDKLVENTNKVRLTWCCFIDIENYCLLEQLINNFILQDNIDAINLLLFIHNIDNKDYINNIKSYINLYDNIDCIYLNDGDSMTNNLKIYISIQNVITPYLTIVNPKDQYKNNYSKIEENELFKC